LSTDNPYTPPAETPTLVRATGSNLVLAGRHIRSAALVLDLLILKFVVFFVFVVLGFVSYMTPSLGLSIGLGDRSIIVIAAVLVLVVPPLIHGRYLKANGQTIGKMVLGIRAADLDGNVPSFARLVFVRLLPVTVACLVPPVGWALAVIDALFILRRDRRCLHDLLAGTQVVVISHEQPGAGAGRKAMPVLIRGVALLTVLPVVWSVIMVARIARSPNAKLLISPLFLGSLIASLLGLIAVVQLWRLRPSGRIAAALVWAYMGALFALLGWRELWRFSLRSENLFLASFIVLCAFVCAFLLLPATRRACSRAGGQI
jgi:uncharacterized RDD family membrane protein YckC